MLVSILAVLATGFAVLSARSSGQSTSSALEASLLSKQDLPRDWTIERGPTSLVLSQVPAFLDCLAPQANLFGPVAAGVHFWTRSGAQLEEAVGNSPAHSAAEAKRQTDLDLRRPPQCGNFPPRGDVQAANYRLPMALTLGIGWVGAMPIRFSVPKLSGVSGVLSEDGLREGRQVWYEYTIWHGGKYVYLLFGGSAKEKPPFNLASVVISKL